MTEKFFWIWSTSEVCKVGPRYSVHDKNGMQMGRETSESYCWQPMAKFQHYFLILQISTLASLDVIFL